MLSSDIGYLRKLNEDDLEMILNWRNNEHVRKFMYTDHLISMEEHLAWFNRIKDRQDCIYLIFEYKGCPVGLVNFTSIDRENRKCYFGFYLGETNGTPGLGTLMEYLSLDYAFEQIEMRKLYCEVFVFNQKVVKLHKKFGFAEEGCFKEHMLKEGIYEDVLTLATFKDDWLQNKSKLGQVLALRFSKA